MSLRSFHIYPACMLSLLALQGCDGVAQAQRVAEDAPVVSVTRARVTPISSSLTLAGTLMPLRVAVVHAATPGLVVTELLVEEGQWVRAGQVLARLSQKRLRAELAGARGELMRAQRAMRRFDALTADGALAQGDAEAATASHAQALARVRALEIDLAGSEVRAPVAGLVLRRRVEIGEVAGAQALFEIAANGAMEVVADLSESAWQQASVRQRADVRLVNGQAVKGRVTRLSATLDRQTRLGRIWIGLDKPATGIASGASASVQLHLANAAYLAVPQASLLYDEAGPYVFTVAGGKAVRRELVLGLQAGAHAQVIAGLLEGDTVVARAGSLLRAGDPVRIARGTVDAQGVEGAESLDIAGSSGGTDARSADGLRAAKSGGRADAKAAP